MSKNYVIPAKTDIELTGNTKPTYNSYLSTSYFDGTGKAHYGVDLTSGLYTAIGNGKVIYANPTNVGGGIVVEHEWTDTHVLYAIYWHGKPLFKVGDKVTANDYVTNSLQPNIKSLGSMGKHTHFELRAVPKDRGFTYNDKYRQCQAVDPFSILKLRDESVKVGTKLKNYLAYRGFDISPVSASTSAADIISKISGEDIKKALVSLIK